MSTDRQPCRLPVGLDQRAREAAIVPRQPQLASAKAIRMALAGEVPIAEAACKEGILEVSISTWRNEFLDSSKLVQTMD